MAFNIVDLVKDQINDQLLGQIGNVLGTDERTTTTAMDGALPGLLAGLTGAGSRPEGAGALLDAAHRQDDGVLGGMGALLGGGEETSRVIEEGNSTLGSLLGGDALGKLGGVLAGFAGISRSGSGSLLGMLAPIAIGAIKRKITESNLDAGGLASLLGEQKGHVEAAMPEGLMGQLQSEGFFDSIGAGVAPATAPGAASHPTPAPAAESAPAPAPTAAPAPATNQPLNAPHIEAPATEGHGMMRWLLPIAALVVLGIVAFSFLGGNKDDAPTDAAVTEQPIDAEKAAEIDADLPENVQVNKIATELSSIVSDTTGTLEGITDEAGARAALPNLKDANTRLGRLDGVISRLPAAARDAIGPAVQSGITGLQPVADKVLGMPGVGPVIEPVLSPMLEMMQGLAG